MKLNKVCLVIQLSFYFSFHRKFVILLVTRTTHVLIVQNLSSAVGHISTKPRSHLAQIFPIVHDRDKFSDREQSETNQNDENAMCYYLSEYLRMCFQLYEDSSRPFLKVSEHLRTLCERSKKTED